MPPVQRSPSFSMSSSWLPFIILDIYSAPRFVTPGPMAEVMLEVDDFKGRSVHELAANSWKLTTCHSVC